MYYENFETLWQYGYMAIGVGYDLELNDFYHQNTLQVNISIQSQIIAQKGFCTLVAISQPSLTLFRTFAFTFIIGLLWSNGHQREIVGLALFNFQDRTVVF